MPAPQAGRRPGPPATRPPVRPAGPAPAKAAAAPATRPVPPKPPVGRPPSSSRNPAAAAATPKLHTPPSARRGAPARREARPRAAPEAAQRPAPAGGPAGLSVRTKIVLSTAGIVTLAGFLSFVAVYFKAQRQLSQQIDAGGVRMVNTLRGVPTQMWISSMKARGGYLNQAIELFDAVGPSDWKDGRARHESEWNRFVRAAENPNPDELRTSADMKRLSDRLKEVLGLLIDNPKWFESLPEEKQKQWEQHLSEFQRPFGKLLPLADFKEGGRNPEVLMIGVAMVDGNGKPVLPSIDTTSGQEYNFRAKSPDRQVENISVADGVVGDIPARRFKYEVPVEGVGLLSIKVLLSLKEIQAEKLSLLLTVIIPIVVSIGLGVAVAFYVGTLITRPLEQLMADIGVVSSGDLAHETAARSRDEIGQLAVTFNNMTGALRVAHQNELDRKAIEHELSIATDIQANLLPKMIPRPPGLDIGAYYRPSKEVGGDYYDFITIDADHLGIIVADVSGKGIPGSLVMTKTQTLIRMEAERGANLSPSDTLKHVNRMLARDIRKGMFVTALYCVMDLRTCEMSICSAGHNPLMLYRAGGRVDQINPSGIALGFDKGALFDRSIKEEKVILEKGDRFVGYTDGVVEAMNEQREEFTDERFVELIQKLSQKPSREFVVGIVQVLDEFKGAAEQHDDITLVTVGRS